jgi:hypothetical protein
MNLNRGVAALFAFVVLSAGSLAAIGQTGGDVRKPFPEAITNAAGVERIEVRDSSERVVLSGTFVAATERNGTERVAMLKGDASATGRAEVEVWTGNGGTRREMEVDLDRLTPETEYTLFVDGAEVATFTTDAEGDAELDFADAQSAN